MVRSVYFPDNGSLQFDLPVDEIKKVFGLKTGKIWISLEQTNQAEIDIILRDICQFHPLSIEDCLGDFYQSPKLDNLENHLFIIVQAIQASQHGNEIKMNELDIFLGDHYLVTSFLCEKMPPIESLRKRLEKNSQPVLSPDMLCHAILDRLVDDYLPTMEWVLDEIESIEDNLLTDPDKQTLEKVLDLKHTITHFRHVNYPHRDIMTHLSRDEFAQISPQKKIYFRDIYDHLVRLQDSLESARDSITSTLEIYLSSTSIRQNQIMKTLTIVSTIFLPLTFLAGVYGMNFHFMPEIPWKYGYPFAWFVFAGITISMLIFFKRRKWL